MGRRLIEGNYLAHSHKPVHRGAGNGAQAPRGSISVFGEREGVQVGRTMAKWNDGVWQGALSMGLPALHSVCKWGLTLTHKGYGEREPQE